MINDEESENSLNDYNNEEVSKNTTNEIKVFVNSDTSNSSNNEKFYVNKEKRVLNNEDNSLVSNNIDISNKNQSNTSSIIEDSKKLKEKIEDYPSSKRFKEEKKIEEPLFTGWE